MRLYVLFLLGWSGYAAEWTRHVVAHGYPSHAATAADFTGDGRVDVIANDATGRRDILYVAPDWKPVVLRSGADGIFYAAALDADGDGDLDFVGARYSPGLLYWLERPQSPLTQPWRMHVIDDSAKGGVDGIHGLAIGDLNRDGKPDIIANSAQPKGAFPESIVWYEAPKWTRHVIADRDAPGLSHYMHVGDIDGDGRPDVTCAAKIAEGGNWFAWWKQPSDLRKPWQKIVVATGQEGATHLIPARVNDDSRMDLLASRGHGKGVLWFDGKNSRVIDADHPYPHSFAAGDLNGDGRIDAAACSAVYDKQPSNPRLAWFENTGQGQFKTHVISNAQASYQLTLIDMDNDKDLDILIAGQESRNVVWYENQLSSR